MTARNQAGHIHPTPRIKKVLNVNCKKLIGNNRNRQTTPTDNQVSTETALELQRDPRML